MATEVLGLYDTVEAAHSAAQALAQAGFSSSAVTVETYRENSSGSAAMSQESGWEKVLAKLHTIAPKRDSAYYSEGIRDGQTLVTVTTSDEQADSAADILDSKGAIDIESNVATYHQGMGTPSGSDYGQAASLTEKNVATDSAVIPVIEEELQVGKRQIQRGGVRVYQHITERPVDEQINLHDETVTVNRRVVDRPVTDADNAFTEKTLEVTETKEVPVVAKAAHVVEEVVVGKTSQDRVETIHDTVRRTDVNVEELDSDDLEIEEPQRVAR